jgi:O-glycosyl hydrolase
MMQWLELWADILLGDKSTAQFIDGVGLHW